MMEKRIDAISAMLSEGEAALITNDSDRFYLTGFESSAGIVFITKKSRIFLIDFRYIEKAKSVVKHMDVRLLTASSKQLGEIIKDEKITKIFARTQCISVKEFSDFNKSLGGILSTDERLDKTLDGLRRIKSSEEIKKIRKAQDFTEQTFDYILPRIEAGRTEREVMLDMEFYMRGLGSEGVAFDFIVVSGKNSSLPHGVPSDKKIERGDFVTMDFGAVFEGYRSDMTRTVAVGEVSDKQRLVYDTVLEAQLAAMEAIQPGKICKVIDAVARDLIYSRGYEGCFGHGLGHSVGVDIHEMPAFNTRCDTVLEPGMVLTVEPGIYLENEFGVRIEDMVLITDDGCAGMTFCRKDLIIL